MLNTLTSSDERNAMTTILVVEDSSAMRMIAVRMLKQMGLTVTQAENGKVGLDACLAAMPDGVLLDWNMPVMDGPSFLTALRAAPGGERPQVIFCTSESDMEKIATVIGAGANEFIMKPYDEEILRSKLALVGLVAAEMCE